MDTLLKTRCTGGHLLIYPDKVSIELHALGTHKVNAIMLNQITGVELKTTRAAIKFFNKGSATVTVHGTGSQKLEANLVDLTDAQKAQEIINDLLNKNASKGSSGSNLDELEKLSSLKEKGIITQEEFEQKKKQLLGLS